MSFSTIDYLRHIVDYELVWDVVTHKVPELKDEIAGMIAEKSQPKA
jgi:uncharacterized protein with HEPN domain